MIDYAKLFSNTAFRHFAEKYIQSILWISSFVDK